MQGKHIEPIKIVSEPRALLSVKQVAERLSIAEKTIYNRISKRAKDPFPIRVKRFMGKPLFDNRDVEAFIESLPYEVDAVDKVFSEQ